MMKKETLARILVLVLISAAILIPLSAQYLAAQQRSQSVSLRARMPENGGWSLDTIQAQVGEPVHLRMTSEDVVHGFAIGQMDTADIEIRPGEYADTTLTFEHPGRYTFYCTRWCGSNHWRMRGTIEVTGPGQTLPPPPQPLFLKLSIDIDAGHDAKSLPAINASPERGAAFADRLPAQLSDRYYFRSTSPEAMWDRLRADPDLADLSDQDAWDAVAWVWQQQAAPGALEKGQQLYAQNCAACHGEAGKGDGVITQGLPRWEPGSIMNAHSAPDTSRIGRYSPPDFTDPRHLLGASPALLEGKIIRGGMGTGMPYWGPIFTPDQIEALVAYLYQFAWQSPPR